MENTAPAASPLDIPVMQHTPAPWAWGSFAAGVLVVPCTTAGHPDKHNPICNLQSKYSYPLDDETVANANLLSAAPDLLAALGAVMYWDNGKPEWDDARAAIAKALGHNA